MANKVVVQRRSLCKIASAVLGRSTPKYLALIDHWLKHKGVEWTVERLKCVSNAAYQIRAGDVETAHITLKQGNVKTRKDNLAIPSGILGSTVSAFVDAQQPKALKKAAALLRVYTGLSLVKPSVKQYEKAKIAINTPLNFKFVNIKIFDDLPFANRNRKVVRDLVSTWDPVRWSQIQLELPLASGMAERRPQVYQFNAWALSGNKSYYTGRYTWLDSSSKKRPYASAALSSLVCGDVPRSAVLIMGDLQARRNAWEFQKFYNDKGMGKISMIQEGGAKARVVCVPSFWMQVYFRPLHKILMNVIKEIETHQGILGHSCVLNQNRGAYALQRWMRENIVIDSFDLSSATDRFPRDLQTAYLKSIGLRQWALAIDEASEGWYQAPTKQKIVSGKDDNKAFWSWSAGQPMGVYGSFPLFHLTHLALLDTLACNCGSKPDAYCVLGDDVMIADPKLSKEYTSMLEMWGVPISAAKSFHSLDLAQFAGFTGVTSNGGVTVFRPFKHGKDFAIVGNELNVLSAFGSEVRSWSKFWSDSWDIFQSTRSWREPDLSPILHDDDFPINMSRTGSRWFASLLQAATQELQMFLGGRYSANKLSYNWESERHILFGEQEASPPKPFDPRDISMDRKPDRSNQILRDPIMSEGFRNFSQSRKSTGQDGPSR